MNKTAAKTKELIGKAGPLMALILLCIFLAFKNENFFTATNLLNVARQAALNGFPVSYTHLDVYKRQEVG